jgi:DNA-binding transcriptional LysR family regulator
MEIRHLRAFVAVADTHSMRQASRRIAVAQSALSRTIRDLERELGVPLFLRTTHGARLTDAGERFLDGARRTLAEASAAIARARDARSGRGGPFVVGVVNPELRPAWIQAALRRYQQAMPGVPVHLEAMASIAMTEAVADRAIDVGLGYELSAGHGLAVAAVTYDALAGVCMARDHVLARRRSVSVADLEPYPFLWYDRAVHPTMFERIFAAFRQVGFAPEHVPAIGQVDANAASAFALVSSSQGWALYPTTAIPALPSTMRYVRLSDLSIPLATNLLRRAEDTTARTRTFAHILDELADDGTERRVRASVSP